MKNAIKIALAGNPNSGKSTIFNKLTGAKQTVGNFPGVTVERYEGRAQFEGRSISVVDLPGVYSLASYSDEERVAAEFLKNETPDVVVNVVDASNLERNLYLTLVLKEQNRPLVVVLNMIDVARRRGIDVDAAALSKELGVPVLQTVGNRGVGVQEILAEVVRVAESPNAPVETSVAPACPSDAAKSCEHCGGECELAQTAADVARYKEIGRVCARCVKTDADAPASGSDKIDAILTHRFLGIPIFLAAMYLVFQLTFTLGSYPMDWIDAGFGALADWVDGAMSEGVAKSLIIDGVIGGVGGVLVFLPNILILFLAISILEDSGYMARAALLCDRWMRRVGLHGKSVVPALVGFGCTVPGIMAAKMLSDRKERLATMFVLPLFSCGARFPIYALLIPAFFPLEWQGLILWGIYLIGILLAAVVAKVMDVVFKNDEPAPFVIELPSYHCPTLGVVGVHTLERGWQYVKKAGTIIFAISVLLWALTTFPNLDAETVAKFDAERAQIEENADQIRAEAAARLAESTESAESAQPEENAESTESAQLAENTEADGAEVAADETEEEADPVADALAAVDAAEGQAALERSYAGRVGRALEPMLRPMGFDWKIGTALIGAIAAKEVFVAQMGVVYSVGEADETSEPLAETLRANYSPLVGFCIMLFCLIATPCMATFAVMAREAGSWKWAFAQWFGLTAIAWVLTTLVYQIGKTF
ncbi:MAG: ferrous iron transport protein B [Thermoguttaceae bacterium]|nr:ferrous iron transport protein B [Thermoguttaceae bacterium]